MKRTTAKTAHEAKEELRAILYTMKARALRVAGEMHEREATSFDTAAHIVDTLDDAELANSPLRPFIVALLSHGPNE